MSLCLAFASLAQLEKEKLDFLHPKEVDYYNTLHFAKRQHSYLLGHFCAKEAIKSYHFFQDAKSILIKKGVFEQPLVDYPQHLKTHITLSHAEPLGTAIAFPEEYPMGIDLEHIRDQIETVMTEQLTVKENEAILSQNKHSKTVYYTLYWTVKEALSKALRTGMTVPFTLYAIKNLNRHHHAWECEFEHFTQYKAISFLLDNSFICSIVYPKESYMNIDIADIHHRLSSQLSPKSLPALLVNL